MGDSEIKSSVIWILHSNILIAITGQTEQHTGFKILYLDFLESFLQPLECQKKCLIKESDPGTSEPKASTLPLHHPITLLH